MQRLIREPAAVGRAVSAAWLGIRLGARNSSANDCAIALCNLLLHS
jgi:hypothetical protein